MILRVSIPMRYSAISNANTAAPQNRRSDHEAALISSRRRRSGGDC
jgi:hypothetical protein